MGCVILRVEARERETHLPGRKWDGASCVLWLAHLVLWAPRTTAQEVFPTPACVVP